MSATSGYTLPRQVDKCLASAAKYLQDKGRDDFVTLIANARLQIEESVEHDNWDGGQTGHGLVLHVPEALFHSAVGREDELGQELGDILKKFVHVPHEYLAYVRVALDLDTVSPNWRAELGGSLTQAALTQGSDKDLNRLWGNGAFRVFLSHRADFKVRTKALKEELAKYGAASFVAHEDIEPTRSWQSEIEKALGSMDVLVTVLTHGFSASYWTNQEVGVALGRGVPIVSLRIDEDPPGFISVTQAVNGRGRNETEWARDLVSTLSSYERLSRGLLVGLVQQWEAVTGYVEAIRVMNLLEACMSLPVDLVARIEAAYGANDQLYGCAGVYKKYPLFLKRVKTPGVGATA